ncbi:YqiA/YcfP family alpha/beta fold hydrolase [Flammeovirga agarivorans]|uniref:Alpha/beta hydrolase n=1 Tax=Flammeovirga agarivorans TaxID=2726742 RepID=A0A7X8XVU4_9BACT|nr:alpha/beta hydrolase [Flammeovirga agarivorans]NLR91667.1 alpha/beta hydrolase [Flammeovirga agarivorans]
MKQSITYYLTLLVIRLKGIKRNFSQDPIDVSKIRKEDVHHPSGRFFKKYLLQTFKISDSNISEIGVDKNAENLLIFIHGGAFISGPAQHHWDTIIEIAKRTNYKIWMCDYPKAPESQIDKISENIDTIYSSALEKHQADRITIIGDSVGGTLVTALTQRLLIKKVALPNKLILVSPVMDASMSNPDIEHYEQKDPMLSKTGVLSAKKMCAGNIDLKEPMISPLYGTFEGFPKTLLFLAQNDIMYPDGKLAQLKMEKSHVNLKVFDGENMPHIWPFLPVMKEAKTALDKIIDEIKVN